MFQSRLNIAEKLPTDRNDLPVISGQWPYHGWSKNYPGEDEQKQGNQNGGTFAKISC